MLSRTSVSHAVSVAALASAGMAWRSAVMNWLIGPLVIVLLIHLLGLAGTKGGDQSGEA